jgi:hypothetical protein
MTKTKSEHRWVTGQGLFGAPTDVQVICYACGKRFMLSTGWADAAGEPFKAYYCRPCKEEASK